MELKLNQVGTYIKVVGEGIPKQVSLLATGVRYGSEELDIAYGKYEKHTSVGKLIKNIKQILWRKN